MKTGEYRLPDDRTKVRAHDIRHLCVCGICGGIGDERTSISYNGAYGYSQAHTRKIPDAFWHPACCFEQFGEKFVLDMPVGELEKFRMCDAPIKTIKKIVEAIEDAREDAY